MGWKSPDADIVVYSCKPRVDTVTVHVENTHFVPSYLIRHTSTHNLKIKRVDFLVNVICLI